VNDSFYFYVFLGAVC